MSLAAHGPGQLFAGCEGIDESLLPLGREGVVVAQLLAEEVAEVLECLLRFFCMAGLQVGLGDAVDEFGGLQGGEGYFAEGLAQDAVGLGGASVLVEVFC